MNVGFSQVWNFQWKKVDWVKLGMKKGREQGIKAEIKGVKTRWGLSEMTPGWNNW